MSIVVFLIISLTLSGFLPENKMSKNAYPKRYLGSGAYLKKLG